MDAFYWQPKFQMLDIQLERESNSLFPLVTLSDGLTNGDHGGVKYTPIGVRYLRGQSVTEFGLNLLEDQLYISEAEHERMKRAEVVPSDILYTIAGSVGTACVVKDIEFANINQALVRIRVNQLISPEYLSYFLNSNLGKLQSERKANGGVQLNINFQEVKSLQIIVPPLEVQEKLVAELDAARMERDRALKKADDLFLSLDELVKSKLGLSDFPDTVGQRGYAIQLNAAKIGNSLSADYFHPERIRAIKQIQSLPNAALHTLVNFHRDVIKIPDNTRYIGLASVASHTGQLTEAIETASGQCFTFKKGDVLFGRLRPYLNKVWLTTFDGVCSTEFHVMRSFNTAALRPEYLAVVMRTHLIVAQTKHMMTGNTHPRLANDDVINLLIPLTDQETQQQIVTATLEQQAEAAELRVHAETVWRKARENFEKQLLQGSE